MDAILKRLRPVAKRPRRRERLNGGAEGGSDVSQARSQQSGVYATDFATDSSSRYTFGARRRRHPPGGAGQSNSQAKNTLRIIVHGKFWLIGILQLRVTVPLHFSEIPTMALCFHGARDGSKKNLRSTDFVSPIIQERFHRVAPTR
jgi:hypothetical protein